MGATRINYVAKGLEYARQVVSGEIPACRWVKLACQRQLDDLERTDWQWRFDEQRANRICYFIELLPHLKGKWKTPNITLEPHQCFRLTTIFGWVDAEGLRRFRKALIVLPRKNGKTTEAAGVGNYLLEFDDEPGAEVYAAAVTRDQVTGPSGVWTIAKQMVQRSPGIQARGVQALAHSIVQESKGSYFKPLSRDADALEGLNPHGIIIDELHAHKTREVFDVMDEATGARKQPLMYIISTEGDNPTGVFAEQVAYAQHVLEGRHDDPHYFGIIYTIDIEDDWTSPLAWRKANPNMGVSVYETDMEVRCRQAERNPASQSSFLTKRLNVRVGAGEAYFNMLAWRTICLDRSLSIEQFVGQPCILALDLASKDDLAAKIYWFRRGPKRVIFGQFYLPEDVIQRGHENYDIYRGWAEMGLLTLTPGNVIDFEFIERDLLEDRKRFDVRTVAYDPFQARQLSTRMESHGLPMLEIPQSVMRLSEPMKEMAALIVSGRLLHDGNPIMDWNFGNVMAKVDAKDNVYPRKARPNSKIDGAVGGIMANGVDMFTPVVPESIYNDRKTCIV